MSPRTPPTYDTPPGQDNSLVAEIQPGVNIHKHHGHYFVRGAGYNTEMFNDIINLIDSDQLVFISATGPPGKGKSWFVLRLMELLDKRLVITDAPAPPPDKDRGQVAFTRPHLKHLIGKNTPLKHYQAVMVDESHFGLGARSWAKAVQQDIISILCAVRSKRLIFFVVALSMKQIDNYLRDFVVNFQFTIEAPGVATLYKRKFHKLSGDPLTENLGMWYLPIPWGDWCNNPDCIGCPYLFEDRNPEGKRCPNPRACYERRKDEFLNTKSEEEDEEAEEAEAPQMTPEEATEKLRDFAYSPDFPIHIRKNGTATVIRGELADFIAKKLQVKPPKDRPNTKIARQIEASEWWPGLVAFRKGQAAK
jgi:hypothetical protein